MEPGKELTFYNAYTLEKSGQAVVVKAVETKDEQITHAFWETLKKANILTWDVVPQFITLDRDVQISELEMVDSKQASPDGKNNTQTHSCSAQDHVQSKLQVKLSHSNVCTPMSGAEPAFSLLQARPKHLTFINNYLHDSLASGINVKGADCIVVEGNVVQRAGCRGIGAGFDPYWWEVRLVFLVSVR